MGSIILASSHLVQPYYESTANYTEQVIVTNLRTDPLVVKRLFNADPKYKSEMSSTNCMFLCCLLCKKRNKKTEFRIFLGVATIHCRMKAGHNCLKYHQYSDVNFIPYKRSKLGFESI